MAGTPVSTVLITPPSAVVGVGASWVLGAIAVDSNGATLTGKTLTWSSSNPATVSVNATTGSAIGVASGSATITATSEGKSGKATIFVAAPVSTVAVQDGGSTTVIAAATKLLTAVLKDVSGSTLDGRAVTWSSSSNATATVNAHGLVTAVVPGSVTITATSEGRTGATTLTVSADQIAPQSITAGLWHSCGLTSAGRAYCWGVGTYLGVSPAPLTRSPVEVAGGRTYTAIAAAGVHTIALTSAGEVYAWGQGSNGQLGNGSTLTQLAPVKVAIPGPVRAIDAGASHSIVVTTTGAVYTWGANLSGQIGNGASGATGNQLTPYLVTGLPATIQKVAAGSSTSFAITGTGVAYGWGESNEVGDGTGFRRTTPVLVAGSLRWADIAPGEGTVVGLTTGGLAYSWGGNTEGSLGHGTLPNSVVLTPTAVAGNRVFTSISSGYSFTIGLTANGDAYAWGINWRGNLGDGTTTSRATPTLVSGGKKFSAVAAGREHAIAFTTEGQAWGWGKNDGNQTGDGTSDNRSAPVGPAAPAFTMTSPSGQLAITQGRSATASIQVARTTGGFSRAGILEFTGSVAFETSPGNAGITATVAPSTFVTGQSATMQVTVSAATSAALGAASVSVMGKSPGLTDRTSYIALNVTAPPPPAGSGSFKCTSETTVLEDGYQCVSENGKLTAVKFNIPELWGTWVDRTAGLCITWNQNGKATGTFKGGGLLGGAARTTAPANWGAMATSTGGYYPNPTQWYIYTAALDDQTKLLGYDSSTKQIVGWSFTKESCPW